MPELFKEQGYKTFFAGKWHLGSEGSYPEDHGFDFNQGGYEKGGPYSGGYFSPFNNPKMKDHDNEKYMSLPMKLANETVNFIENHQKEPFFAFLSFYAVHGPIQTNQEKWAKYREKAVAQGLADKGFIMERRLPYRQQQDNPVYAGLIEHMDDAVGRVLESLERLNLAENTIIVFTSDNGGVVSGDNYSTNLAPLRGGKGYQWEGGIRVPFLVDVPWMKNKGKKNDVPVIATDFFPTLLDLAGLNQRPDLHEDGVSLVPLLEGENISERALIWHYPHYGNQGGDPSSIIRSGDWKLILYHETDQMELYNLKNDLEEQQDLAKQHPELADQLKKDLQERLQSLNVKQAIADPHFSLDSFKMKEKWFANDLMQRLEKQRQNFLDPKWQPNKTWWGSQTTDD
jgi:arylsulfatase A-like enzyme